MKKETTIQLNERKLKWIKRYHSEIQHTDHDAAKQHNQRFYGTYNETNDTFTLYFRYLNNRKANSGEALFCWNGKLTERKGGIDITGHMERVWEADRQNTAAKTAIFVAIVLAVMVFWHLKNNGFLSIAGFLIIAVLFVYLQVRRSYDNAETMILRKIKEM
jgi:hypothetical protein